MPATVVLGMQWGDEGKGKIVDFLAGDCGYAVRFNGGDNAGHAVKFRGVRVGLRLVPASVFHPRVVKVIGNGVVVNPDTLMCELEEIGAAGLDPGRLVVSHAAHLVMPWHISSDMRSATRTTRRGVGPAYSEKAGRARAIRVGDLFSGTGWRSQIRQSAADSGWPPQRSIDKYLNNIGELEHFLDAFKRRFPGRVGDASAMLNRALDRGERVLLEGAQGAMLDVDHGTYPFVTSSSTTIGGACAGSGISHRRVDRVVGVVKAYATRVGDGPFPTELAGRDGDALRGAGVEFGSAAGILRRCGWLDAVALKHAVMLNGPDELAVTKLDVLAGLPEVKVCTAYRAGRKRHSDYPAALVGVADLEPEYASFDGWPRMCADEWSRAKKACDLPAGMRKFIEFVVRETGIPVRILSHGPCREETCVREP